MRQALVSLLTVKDLSPSAVVFHFEEKSLLGILIKFLRAEIVEKIAYDLMCATRLIISFGTVIKIIFIRCDQIIVLGRIECFTRVHAPRA